MIATPTRTLGLALMSAVGIFGTTLADAHPWRVRTYVAPWSGCMALSADLTLRTVDGDVIGQHVVPVDRSESPINTTWAIAPPPGSYLVQAAVTDCDGARSPSVSLDVRLDRRVVELSFLLLVRGRDSPEPVFFEVDSDRDSADTLSVVEQDHVLTLRNLSETPIRRCEYDLGGTVDVEWLVDGRWGEPGRSESFDWDRDDDRILPGETLTLRVRRAIVLKLDAKVRGRPEGKRYVVPVQPELRHFVLVGKPPEGVAIVPACDRYVVEVPAARPGIPGDASEEPRP